MNIDDVVNIEDLHLLARRKLPKVMFDYIEGGVEDAHSSSPPPLDHSVMRSRWP